MSAAGAGRLSRSASKVVVRPANGFHLLRIDGYSQTKTILPGQKLSSQQFIVGDQPWRIDYYPNGRAESNSDAIAVYLQLIGGPTKVQQQARYKFSLLDNAGIAAYELPADIGSFTSVHDVYAGSNPAAGAGEEPGPGCGHDEFIGKEELERRRDDLIRDDSIVIRCDVGVTQIESSYLAQDDIIDEQEYGMPPPPGYGYAPPRRHGRQHRVADAEYIEWCLTKEPGGSRGRRQGGDYY